MSLEDEFSRIVASRAWSSGETPCGPGSMIEACSTVLKVLPEWIAKFQITSIADLGCGDFHWMSRLDLSGIEYDGYDVVQELISSNQSRHSGPNIRFHHADFMTIPVPKVDLIVCKDVLPHLPNDLVLRALGTIQASGSRLLAATTAVGWAVAKREGLRIGGFSPVDLEALPFLMGAPLGAVEVPMKPGNPQKLFSLWDLYVKRLSK